ncbi:hypothetical protein MKX01_000790 [Papaver californicum]|nr:hypothetical protein MKX01_000790 [Papaver californicum]
MSWGLGWKRSSEIFRLTLVYGDNDNDSNTNVDDTSLRIELDLSAADDEDQIALRLQSQLAGKYNNDDDEKGNVGVDMKVFGRTREALRLITLSKAIGSGQQPDGNGVLTRLIRSNLEASPRIDDGFSEHWKSVTCLRISGCSLSVFPVELTRLPLLEKLYLDINKVTQLPPELGELTTLKILMVDYNMLASVPAELRQCVGLVELSLEHNKLVHPLLDFRAMSELCILRLFPSRFYQKYCPYTSSTEISSSYFTASRHRLSVFLSLIFRSSSCHHPLLASALAKTMQDDGDRIVVGKDENAVRQLITSSALSALATDVSAAIQLMKSDIMQPIESLLRSRGQEEIKSVLSTLLAVGNLAFCLEDRRTLVTSKSLRELLLCLMVTSNLRVYKAAARRPIAKQGLRILAMDGGGMKGLATVQMLKQIEQGTGKRIHEMFDLICGTSTGGMLAVALGIKQMSLDECEEIYKKLGKLVFAEPINEAATWREKLDQLCKSSSRSFRVVVHGSKHSADQFEKLLKEMCADEEGDLLIESTVKSIPKVFVVSTLVSVAPAQPFLFRNYQYPAGIQERPFGTTETKSGPAVRTDGIGTQAGLKHCAFIGSCKHHIWQAIRASSAAPYYLDDFSDDVNRWQGGAIVAKNPTIFAIREAQLLWPDGKSDCLVSIGCGSVPTKVRKGRWRYLDTGQVLIESACSTNRVEEELNMLLPLLPEIQYFRFEPADERCDMELYETDPAIWLKLENATQEYIEENSETFKNVCDRLLLPQDSNELNCQYDRITNLSNTVIDEKSPSLGRRHLILLVEASHSPDSGRAVHHARSLETFCSRTGIRLSSINRILGFSKSAPATTFATPFASPLFTGSFLSSPFLYSPEAATQRVNRIDLVPPLRLDGSQTGKSPGSPPKSPMAPRELSALLQLLQEKLQSSPQVGIIHLALQNDAVGSMLHNDVFVAAEPGELADRSLRNVKLSFMSMVMDDKHKSWTTNTEIGAYIFYKTVPSIHLSPDDVRWMTGAWRDRIIICSGAFGLTPSLVKIVMATFYGSGEFNPLDNGRFEIGDEETEEEDMQQQPHQPSNPVTQELVDKEEELSRFICLLYDTVFWEGARVDWLCNMHLLHIQN